MPGTILYSRATQVKDFALKESYDTIIKGFHNCYVRTQEGEVWHLAFVTNKPDLLVNLSQYCNNKIWPGYLKGRLGNLHPNSKPRSKEPGHLLWVHDPY